MKHSEFIVLNIALVFVFIIGFAFDWKETLKRLWAFPLFNVGLFLMKGG